MEYYQSIERIFGQISEKNRELADLFKDLARGIIEESDNNQGSLNNSVRISKSINRRIKEISDPYGRYGEINVIPGDFPTSCHKSCTCFAFDKWQSSKGFRGIANKTIDYWLSCFRINESTIIFTTAWDDLDFSQNFKNRFDRYSNDPQHTVVIVQISSNALSLQYLN